MSEEFRVVEPADEAILSDLFADIDETYFRPHPFTRDEAERIACRPHGRDVYAVLVEDGRALSYGMLRGLDEGYPVPSLGIAVRTSAQGRGRGRAMMGFLHAEAGRRGVTVVRLRVHPENLRARRLYEDLGYAYAGEDRGELVMLLDVATRPIDEEAAGRRAAALTGALVDADAAEWREVLRASRHDFYHLPAYATLSAVGEGARACALHVTDGTRTMLLPLILRRIPGGRLDAASPYGYPGPIGEGIDDGAFLRLALVAGQQVLRDAGLVSTFIRLHPVLNESPPQGVGTLVPLGETVLIDLTLSEEAIRAQTRPTHRLEIGRALRLGCVARMDDEWSAFGEFKRLYRATMDRRSAAPFYFFDDRYFAGLRAALGERLHLCVVERDGLVLAAGLFVDTDGIVQYHLSGSDDRHRDIQATKLMLHFVTRWAKDQGCRVFHLGGGVGGAADSLLQFKAGFSRRRATFSTLRMVIDEAEYARLVAVRDPALDPHARTGFFPMYRDPGKPGDHRGRD